MSEKIDIDREFDNCLKKMYDADRYTMFASDLYDDSFMYNVSHPTDEALISRGLITRNKDARMLTELGLRICRQGGWLAYQKEKIDEEKVRAESQAKMDFLTRQQLELSIREMTVNFTQIKYWWLILLVSMIGSAFLGAWLQSIFK